MHLKAVPQVTPIHTEVATGQGTAPGLGLQVTAEWSSVSTCEDFGLRAFGGWGSSHCGG